MTYRILQISSFQNSSPRVLMRPLPVIKVCFISDYRPYERNLLGYLCDLPWPPLVAVRTYFRVDITRLAHLLPVMFISVNCDISPWFH